MELLTTLKTVHVLATVVVLLGGLGLAVLAWRQRSADGLLKRPWLFGWLLIGLCVLSMPFSGWWLVHLVGWPLGQTWLLGSSLLYTLGAFSLAWLVARLAAAKGHSRFTFALAVVSGVCFIAIAGLMGAKPV